MKLVNNKKLMEAVNSMGLSNVENTIADAKEENIVTEVEVPIGMGDNYAESQKAKKHFMKVTDEKTKEAEEVVPENPTTGKPLEKNMYTKLTLDESLFESAELREGTSYKRISHYSESDNPHILRRWEKWSDEEAEEKAKQASLKDPDDIYYVQYDDIMNPSSDLRWVNGKSYHYSKVAKKGGKIIIEESADEQKVLKEDAALSPDSIDQKPGFEDWPEDEKSAKALTKGFIGKWISELDSGEYDLFNTVYQDLVHNPTAAGGNIPGPKGYRATADMELQDIDANISAFDGGIKVKGKDAEALEKAKRIAMRYYDYGVFYEMKDFNDKHNYYTKELFIFIPEADDFNEETPLKRTDMEEVEESVQKPIKEANVIKEIDLNNYESNEAGQVTLDRIKEAGRVSELEALLEDMYPNGINEATLDDLLRFESDWLFDMLGISDED